MSTRSLSSQHSTPDQSLPHTLNAISVLVSLKFISPSLTSPLGFGLLSNTLSVVGVKLNTFKKLNFRIPPGLLTMCGNLHSLFFMPQTWESTSTSLSPAPIHPYVGLLLDLQALPPKHILNLSTSLHPHLSQPLQRPSNGSPSHSEEKFKFSPRTQKALPTSQISFSDILSLTFPFQPLCFPQRPPTSALLPQGLCTYLPFSLLGMAHHMAGFCYVGLDSYITSLDK